ncbi:helix-turn-helix domain-containing protein [Rhodopila sp.]|uniref:helix-turn-helix domain-containing protein n=1 Tax=Rhodopila sp. TaxID=2480087 RepID=UPI003D0E660D
MRFVSFVAEIIQTSPTFDLRWRCDDLRNAVAERFSVTVHEQTVGKWLRKLGLTRLPPRPLHPKKDVKAQHVLSRPSPGR